MKCILVVQGCMVVLVLVKKHKNNSPYYLVELKDA